MSSAEEKSAEAAAAVAHVTETASALENKLAAAPAEVLAVSGVPLPNVKGPVMVRVLEYLNGSSSSDAAAAAEEVKDKVFDEKAFFDKMTKEVVFEVILAANYLHAEKLLDAAVQCVADRILGKNDVPELREYFGIVNDFTPEEEEEIRKENSWAFD